MSIMIDFVFIILLAATCGYCYMLNRKLNELKTAQNTLGDAIAVFDEASKRAQSNIDKMETLARRKSGDANTIVVKGQDIISELSIMVSAGERIANRIEAAIDDVKMVGKKSSARLKSKAA